MLPNKTTNTVILTSYPFTLVLTLVNPPLFVVDTFPKETCYVYVTNNQSENTKQQIELLLYNQTFENAGRSTVFTAG